jgi:ABC-type phosphate transport system substrate-binding protein
MAMPGSPVSSSALLAPDPAAVLSLVAEDAGAIGYLPLSQVTEEVRVARIDGILPGASTIADGRYPLRLTVLATAPQEPSGQVRDWIGWLQQQ